MGNVTASKMQWAREGGWQGLGLRGQWHISVVVFAMPMSPVCMAAAGVQCWRSPRPPLPDWGGFLLAPSGSSPAARRWPGPSTAPDALVQDPTALYVPSPLLQCWHPQMSQMRFVGSSSFHLGLAVLYTQTLVSQGHKYYQHSLTLSFLKTPKEHKPTILLLLML